LDAEAVSRTMADGARGQAIGRRPFAHLSLLMDDVVTVSEAEIGAAVRLVAEESRRWSDIIKKNNIVVD
jgi:threonine dehydratase